MEFFTYTISWPVYKNKNYSVVILIRIHLHCVKCDFENYYIAKVSYLQEQSTANHEGTQK